MGIIKKNDRILKWKYAVKSIKILIPDHDDITVPSERFNGLEIEENYEEYYFPLIKIKLILSSADYYQILKYKNKCKIFIRIDKYHTDVDDLEPSLKKKYINETFTLIMDENTEDMLKSVKEDGSSDDYKKKKSDADLLGNSSENSIEFYLFKSIIDGTKTNVNKVLANVNVADAIAYLATVAKIDNIVMTQPDNTTIYPEFLIPSMSVLKALAFIDTYYGIYRKSTLMWFGMDYTYIIPYSGACDAFVPNEITTTNIIIPKSTNTDHENALGGLKKKDDASNNYIVCDYSTVSITNKSISNNYLEANSIQAIDTYSGGVSTSTSTATSKKSNFTKIFENNTENSFITEMYTSQSNAKSDIISVRLQDYDVSTISPNKKFNVIFEDSEYTKKYNGQYIAAGVSHSFITEGAELLVNSTLVLRKA